MNKFDEIVRDIDNAIDKFGSKTPGLETRLMELLDNATKELDVKNGRILSNVNNLKQINSLKLKLKKLILNNTYLKQVKEFTQAFDRVAGAQKEYFEEFNKRFHPTQTSSVVRQMAMDSTIDSLTESGVSANVAKPIMDMLKTSVISGGSYADLTRKLRENIISQAGKPSILDRHLKTVTTDALNQFSGQNLKIMSDDLDLEWYRYVGSNKTTSREFCEHLVKKEWIHESELSEVIKGRIDGHQCKVYEKTGLPLGLIPGTNPANFIVNRGGYNCGHKLIPVLASIVPPIIKKRFQIGTDLKSMVVDTIKNKQAKGVAVSVGQVNNNLKTFFKSKDVELESDDILADDKLILHSFRDSKSQRGASLTVDEFQGIHKIIDQPHAVFYEKKTGNIIYTSQRNDGKMIKIVVKPNYNLKKKGKVNMILTTGIVQESNMYQANYTKIK